MSFTVVIPSKNEKNLEQCLAYLLDRQPDANVIVVDDGLECHFDHPQVRFIEGKKPFVFARNCNMAIHAAGKDDVILLNDDALLETDGGFGRLKLSSIEYPDYGLIAASTNNVGNPNQLRLEDCGVAGAAVRGRLSDPIRPEERMLCFVCVYIPRATIEKVGLLDERYCRYGLDDDDYSLRVRNAGLKLGVDLSVFVDHGSLQSTFRGRGGPGGDFRPNMRLFIEKWGVDNWGNGKAASDFKELFPA